MRRCFADVTGQRKARDVFTDLRRLVEQPQTKTTLQRLRDTFNQTEPAAEFIAPVQTVCNYWNYWFTWLPEHLTERRQRSAPPSGSRSSAIPHGAPDALPPSLPMAAPPAARGPRRPCVAATPIAGYSGLQSNGRAVRAHGTRQEPASCRSCTETRTAPWSTGAAMPICQAGQAGYLLGDLRVPGQSPANPAVGVSDIPGNRRPTFWQDAPAFRTTDPEAAAMNSGRTRRSTPELGRRA